MKSPVLSICGVDVQPGERVTLALPTPEIYTCAPLHIPMHIIHGKKEGPRLLICGTFHGDEVNGIAIIQKLLNLGSLKNLSGTLIAIPVMNIYGLINRTRFLPDGHDLESSFPGSETGSFAARLAHIFSSEILDHCTHCLNIRTGGPGRYKIPHILYQEEDESGYRLAKAFNSPLIRPTTKTLGIFYHSPDKPKLPVLVYEAGEANRMDDWAVKAGIRGISKMMQQLEMIRLKTTAKQKKPYEVSKTTWVRAPGSGLFSLIKRVGAYVEKGDMLGIISDPFSTTQQHKVLATESGILIEITTQPLVYEGQVISQIGCSKESISPELPEQLPAIQPDFVNN